MKNKIRITKDSEVKRKLKNQLTNLTRKTKRNAIKKESQSDGLTYLWSFIRKRSKTLKVKAQDGMYTSEPVDVVKEVTKNLEAGPEGANTQYNNGETEEHSQT